MKKLTILIFTFLMGVTSVVAQVAFNTDGSAPDASAVLDIKSTTKGLLLPRMTNNQIHLIASPANGLLVYSTDDSKIYCFNSDDNEWKEIDYGAGTLTPDCGGPFVDARDSQSYNTVQIGTQCWMAENLNIGAMINTSTNQANNGIIEKYCNSNSTNNCITYGGLYQWNEMMQYVTTQGIQGICPSGWHLPTDEEWKTLEMQLGMTQAQADGTGNRGTDEGGMLKETGTAHWNSPNAGATNSSSFTGLPGGHCGYGTSISPGYNAHLWSSNEDGSTAWRRGLDNTGSQIYRGTQNKTTGFSVRCLKD